jgi:antitoxin component of MazEF toxin-antitoxin module
MAGTSPVMTERAAWAYPRAYGDRVEISADGARLIIEAVRPTYVLSDLLVNMTPEAMRDAFYWDEDAGRERMAD